MATRNACDIAGLECVRILTEPVAAAIAYVQRANIDNDGDTIVIYDFGGGTLDVTLLNIHEGQIQVVTTEGDQNLGGQDIDDKIIEWIIEGIKQQMDIDLHDFPRSKAVLREAAYKAKERLSIELEVDIKIDLTRVVELADADLPQPSDQPTEFCTVLNRATFEELCEDVWNRCLLPLMQALEHEDAEDLTKIVCVGGSSRIPRVQ